MKFEEKILFINNLLNKICSKNVFIKTYAQFFDSSAQVVLQDIKKTFEVSHFDGYIN